MYRFYKTSKISSASDPENTFVLVDNTTWNGARSLSVKSLGNQISVMLNNDITSQLEELKKQTSPVVFQEYSGQEEDGMRPPVEGVNIERTYMAMDDSFLYVWSNASSRWKRVPLSDF